MYLDVFHPVEQYLVELRSNILRPIIHRIPKLRHQLTLKEWLGTLARYDVLETYESLLAHF